MVSGLTKTFASRKALGQQLRGSRAPQLTALDDISISLQPRETFGLVGESGSGKSTLARCLVRIVEPDAGSISFDGTRVETCTPDELRQVRRRMQMVYQDPYTSLNPRMSIGAAVSEPARVHGLVGRDRADRLASDLLERVGLPSSVAERRPRELSGGQRQRAAIARALAAQPDLLIADEAVSALDVSVQAQILNLLGELVRDLGLTMLFISHQLSVIGHISQRVAVMYLGRIVEEGPTREVFRRPSHPYTAALIDVNPRMQPRSAPRPRPLSGEIPSAFDLPSGCRFRTRCPLAQDICATTEPQLVDVEPGSRHRAACHRADVVRRERAAAS
jgi:oligopeptide/dipeptide ABC transporter ATP-binding protein